MQLFRGQKKHTAKRPNSPEAALVRQPPSFSHGSLLGRCSLSMAVLTPSLVHLFSKGSGIFPDITYLGVGEGTAITFAVFLDKKSEVAVAR